MPRTSFTIRPATRAGIPRRTGLSIGSHAVGVVGHEGATRATLLRARRLPTRAILRSAALLLIGRLDAAERLLAGFDPAPLLPASRAGHELVIAGIAMRRLQIKAARAPWCWQASRPVRLAPFSRG